ncbi:MAG TPA: hypothetical protein VFA65_04675 [Bryobacteraceae bacterium]|nr:hypothetical protein [Bryobacteraceae bacterium]
MKNKLAFALAGLLALSSATFAADGRDHGYHSDDHRGGRHENYRGGDHGYYHDGYRYRDYGYRGGGAYFGAGPGYYSGYVAPAPYVDPYAYTAPAPYGDTYATPYEDGYIGAAPFAGAFWIGGNWAYGPHGRYWVRGHWGHRR